MGDISPERKPGCGLLSAVFGGRSLWSRRLPSSGSPNLHKPQNGGPDNEFFDSSPIANDPKQADRIIPRPGQNYHKSPPVYHQHQARNVQQHHHDQARNVQHQQNQAQPETAQVRSQQGFVQARKVPQTGLGISGELETMIADHQRSKGAGSLVRASSGNVMLYSNLGNLRQPGGNGNTTGVLDHSPTPANNVAKKNKGPENPVSLCRALSTRMDPEQLKIMGNEDYKNGRFAEAVALYDAAISIDPNKASYRSNKSAALAALGELLEAASECREAIRIDPFYQRAHNRLATLYVR